MLGFSLLTISYTSLIRITESFSQTEEIESKSLSAIHITKDTSNSYVLSDGSSYIGSFDTTYNILGSVSSLQESKNLIYSTVINDYEKSPFIGYIKAENQSGSDSPTLANPFLDIATINKTIEDELQISIESASKLETTEAVIQCNFGMIISKWNCSANGIVG